MHQPEPELIAAYRSHLKADIAFLRNDLSALRTIEDRIISDCRMRYALPDDQDLMIFFWKTLVMGDEIDNTLRELQRKERHLRLARGLSTRTDRFSERIALARDVPIDSLMEFRRGFALCLWHNEKTPSLHYNKNKNRVKCFSCQKYADAIDVAMALFGLSFKDAVMRLTAIS